MAPSDNTNSMDIHTAFTLSDTIAGPGSTCKAALNVTMKITATWVPDPNLPSDPAPPSVKIIEKASVGRGGVNGDGSLPSGDVSNGLGDPPDATGTSEVTPTTDASGKTLVPPAHLSPQSGGSFTITRTFSAHASALNGNAGGTCSASTGLNFYRIEIHAQPYNYHLTGHSDDGQGDLSFTYDWLSTTGDKRNLTDCYSHEHVDYQGPTGPQSYFPPSPFSLANGLDNPTIQPQTDNGSASMAVTIGTDTHYVWASTGPYHSPITVSATQRYEFNDHATGETNTLIPGPDSAPTITRGITNIHPPYLTSIWWYYVTKHSIYAWKQLN